MINKRLGITIFTLTSLLLFCFSLRAKSIEQEPILIPANSEAGFEYPYYLLLPKSLSILEKQYLIVETNNSGVQSDFSTHIEKTRKEILGKGPGPMVADDLDMPLLLPVFPRSSDSVLVYTHALDRDSMLIKNDQSERLDLQLLHMVEDARKQLASHKIIVEKKFVMVGFSASGTFSNRFAILHPSSLLAVSSGAVNSIPMLPIASIEGTRLIYPIGIGDIKEITGNQFDRDSWKSLAQMIYMGAADDNDTLKFSDAFSEDEREIVYEVIGKDMAKRWSKAQSIYLDEQANTTLITYGQIGHWTNGRIRNDMVNFVRSNILKDIRDSKK
jgi:hypothetical protein